MNYTDTSDISFVLKVLAKFRKPADGMFLSKNNRAH